MKRFALILTAIAALAIFSAAPANAFDYGHGGGHHGGYGHGGYGHGSIGMSYGHGFGGHRYAASSYRHGYVQSGFYAAPAYGGHGYRRPYGHRGGLRISTPHFGFRLGH